VSDGLRDVLVQKVSVHDDPGHRIEDVEVNGCRDRPEALPFLAVLGSTGRVGSELACRALDPRLSEVGPSVGHLVQRGDGLRQVHARLQCVSLTLSRWFRATVLCALRASYSAASSGLHDAR
jgi:hypothetical protein